MSRSVVVIGANGQLGSDVAAVFARRGWTVRALVHADLDIRHADAVALRTALEVTAPAAVVNTAAFTNVEGCEVEPERAFAVNAVAVQRLARACRDLGALLVHVSTDYVFDGAKRAPYTEDDAPRPLQVYGTSKLAGEYLARAETARHAVVRSCGLYGAQPCRGKAGANFVRTMLRLAREKGEVAVVDDEFVTPTYTVDLAAQLERIADAGATGLFHATQQGQVSWHDFAAAVFEISGTPVNLARTSAARFPATVRRPPYSVLDNARLREAGLDIMPDWRDALRRYLAEIGAAR
jgi:dTDP-4-dehydrorhamnose reductase